MKFANSIINLQATNETSIKILPILIEALSKNTMGREARRIQAQRAAGLFSGLPASFEDKIDLLHMRYLGDKEFHNAISDIYKATVALADDDNTFGIHYNKILKLLGLQKVRNTLFDNARLAWTDVATTLLKTVKAIKEGTADEDDRDNMEKVIAGFEGYDPTRLNLQTFIKNWFFGSSNTMFFNNFYKISGITKGKGGRFNRETSFTSIQGQPSMDEDGEKMDWLLEDKSRVLNPIQESFGFDIDEIQTFIFTWNGKTTEEKIGLVYESIQESDEISDEMKSQISTDSLRAAFSKISAAIISVDKKIKTLSRTEDEGKKQKLITEIHDLLRNDFIFKETVHKFKEDNGGQSVGIETPTSDKSFDSAEYNRSLLKDVIEKDYPIFFGKGTYHNPLDFRSVINSAEIKEVLKDPKLAVINSQYMDSFLTYTLLMAIIQTDYSYIYSTGSGGGKKSKDDSFDENVLTFFEKEVTNMLEGKVDPDFIGVLIRKGTNLYNDIPYEKMKKFRTFAHLVHRDIATTHAVYESGKKWGELSDDDIDDISSTVLNQLYPLTSTNSRRQFKVLNDRTPLERQRSTITIDALEDEVAKNLIKQEIMKKNKWVAEQVSLQGGGPDVDVAQIITDVKSKLKFSDMFSGYSDITNPVMASNTSYRKVIKHNPIVVESEQKKDIVEEIYSKWKIKNLF
jgi:hypothetical protein